LSSTNMPASIRGSQHRGSGTLGQTNSPHASPFKATLGTPNPTRGSEN
jgi:hypothetical protein